jgi:AraC-like DNA-binding protein
VGAPEGPSVTIFRQVIYGLTEMGLEWKPLFESCGIDPDLTADSEARVTAEVFDRFWLKAAELTGDPCFGLHVGERLRPLAVNVVGYLLMSSQTVQEGLERVMSYQRLVFGRDFLALVGAGSSALIRLEPVGEDPLDEAAQTEFKAMIVLHFLDWITATEFRASEVRFRHPPAGTQAEYERVLKCPVRFRCEHSELVVSQASLNHPSLHANPEIVRIHQEYAERHLAELEDESITRKLKTFLMSHLDQGLWQLPKVARSLYMSPRTLQRRLAEEGHSFSETLDSLRRDLCLHHLEKPGMALAEIAYIAGFSDTSAFTRAVRRWTGQTPLEYRRSHAEQ